MVRRVEQKTFIYLREVSNRNAEVRESSERSTQEQTYLSVTEKYARGDLSKRNGGSTPEQT